MSSPIFALTIGTGVVAALMLVLWLVHLVIKNASIVDIGWAAGLGVMAVVYALLSPGWPLRVALITIMAAIWSIRLSVYLFVRIAGKPEEGRYVQLRREWKTKLPLKFLAFFEFQALLCFVLSTPFLIAVQNTKPILHPLEVAAAALWVIAICGESIADAQLHKFKSDESNKGRICQAGLWNYSRHPNYFFEWLVWVSFALFAFPSPWGFLGLLSPALMLFFLFRVTGIPATEAQAIRSKGDAYRNYQTTTSPFVPWFKRSLQ